MLQPNIAKNEAEICVTCAKWDGDTDHTLLIDCSDPRLPEAREELRSKHIKVCRYDSIIVPGGPAVLTLNEAFCFLERERAKLLDNLHKFQQIIGIAHYDCAYYKLKYASVTEEERCKKQYADLISFRQDMKMLIPGANVELYYAAPNENGFITYTKIP